MNGWNPGFNDTTGGGFLNNTANSPAGKKKGPVKRLQSVVPLVIRQIRDHKDEEFKLFKLPAQMITIVGILKDYEVQSTKVTYTIEDHTGVIKAVWWLDSDNADETPALPNVKEGGYVQVFGTLRSQDGVKVVMVLKMFLVENADVITTHLLEVIHTRLQAEAMKKESVVKPYNPATVLANSMSFLNENNDGGQAQLSAVQQKVYKILQADHSQAGASRSHVLSNFPPNQQKEARDALEFLINEGHAYSTIDNDHFKATDA